MSDCCNARTLEAEAGGQWVWGQPKLHSKTLDSREVQKGIAMEPVFIYMKRSPHVQIKGRSNPHPPYSKWGHITDSGSLSKFPLERPLFPSDWCLYQKEEIWAQTPGESVRRRWRQRLGPCIWEPQCPGEWQQPPNSKRLAADSSSCLPLGQASSSQLAFRLWFPELF